MFSFSLIILACFLCSAHANICGTLGTLFTNVTYWQELINISQETFELKSPRLSGVMQAIISICWYFSSPQTWKTM